MTGAASIIEGFDAHLAAILRGEQPGWPDGGFGDVAPLDARIAFHGIAGLLAARIGALHEWPEQLTNSIRQQAREQAFWEESHRAMLAALLTGLADRGVPALLMKGSALAWSLYADPFARRRGDSDVLIRQQHLPAARAELAAQGFVLRDNPHGLFFQETWLIDSGTGLVHAVDLHWQASDSPALQQVLRVDEYFARTLPLPRLSPHAAMPHPVLTFVQGALNQAWHGAKGYFVGDERVVAQGRLIWAWDNHLLAQYFTPADWDELAALATERRVAPLCLAALQLARNACAAPVPDAVLARLGAAGADNALAAHLGETDRVAAFVTDLAAIPGMADKARFVLGHALPDAAHLRRKYPQAAATPIALLHVRRIAESAWRWARLG